MGLISWIKGQYYDHKFQKAKDFIVSGGTTEAINILEEILDSHKDAPQTLLGVYHSQILKGNKTSVASAANLCGRYTGLKVDCVKFVRTANIQSRALYIDYIQALFCQGVSVLQADFVDASVKYIRDFSSITSLRSLTDNNTLLVALAKALLLETEKSYKQKSLQESMRLCNLIKPYLSNPDFCDLYTNVRFDLGVIKKTTENTIKELCGLFDYAKKNLREKDYTNLAVKGIGFARNLYNGKDYASSLLISQYFVSKYSDAKKIYADSALELYRLASKELSLIVPDILYTCLGEGLAFISALEPFLSFATYREKYISAVEQELVKLTNSNRAAAQNLLLHAWNFAPDAKLIKAVFCVGSEQEKRTFANFIISSKVILSCKTIVNVFVDEIIKFSSFDHFVILTLEKLLDEGKDVTVQYENVILSYSRKATNKKEAIECVQTALKRVRTSNLYSAKAGYLKDYIESGKYYDSAFALAAAESLVGHFRTAEVLITQILLDDSVKFWNDAAKEKLLRKALSFNKKHNHLFDAGAYEQLLPRIERLLSNLAKKIYPSDNSHAIELLYLLRDNNLSWYDTYAALFLESFQKEQESEELADQILKIISEGRRYDSSLKNELWTKYISVKTHICDKDENIAICELSDLLNIIESQCTTTNKSECKKLVIKNLCDLLFSRGKKSEAHNLFNEATADYEQILKYADDFKEGKERLFICKLKSGQKILQKDEQEISALLSQKKDRPSQCDLAFRWCIYLLSKGNTRKAESINSIILGNDSEILQICQQEKVNSKQKILDGLNENIQKLNESTLSPEDALKLGRDLSKTLDDIKLIVQVSSQKANVLKESIRLYAIEEFYKKGDALKSLGGMMVQDSTYLSDPIALRNMAIMSLVAAENGQLTKVNYKGLLALWATAIYQQRIFVKSLDFTSWDDTYTFSLDAALGKSADIVNEKLPDNVNYNVPDGTHVISILEVQKSLISRMEKAIEGDAEYLSFFSSQLEAMNLLATQHLDIECVVVAPYLASVSSKYMKEIEQALSYEASQHYDNWEEILKIGNLYGLTHGNFNRYSSALIVKDSILLAIQHKYNLAKACHEMHLVKHFAGLYSEVVSAVTTCMNNSIAQEVNYRTFDKSYREAIRAISDDTLTFLYSNYINQQAVKSLNETKDTLAQIAPILFEIYEFCKCNPHLKRNVENIVEALIHNYITNGDNNNLPVLDKVLTSTREFDQFVVKALKGSDGVPEDMMILLFSSNEARFTTLMSRIGRKSVAIQRQFDASETKVKTLKIQLQLGEIVQKVNNNTMEKYVALKKVYELYSSNTTNKNNEQICKNLAALIPMCVMECIIPDERGKMIVKKVLDSLKSNMSSTFRSHNANISEAYNMIWNQLPYNARSAIQNSPWTLNEQGKALKEGLDYLNALK